MALACIDGGRGRRNRVFVRVWKNPWDSTTGDDFSRPKVPAMEATWGQGASVGSTDIGKGGSDGL